MKNIGIIDTTFSKAKGLTFKERLTLVRGLAGIGVDAVELGALSDSSEDILFIKTVAPFVKNTEIIAYAGESEGSAKAALTALAPLEKKRIAMVYPVSALQIEYFCHVKPAALLEKIKEQARVCSELSVPTEFTAIDATRADKAFLSSVIDLLVENKTDRITLCDSEGVMTPEEISAFVSDIVSEYGDKIEICFAASDSLYMAVANTLSAVRSGASAVKTCLMGSDTVSLEAFVKAVSSRGNDMGISVSADGSSMSRLISQISFLYNEKSENSLVVSSDDNEDDVIILKGTTVSGLSDVIKSLGYVLSADDIAKVYEHFERLSERKPVSGKELETVIAAVADEVPPTYILRSYIVNTSDKTSPMAQVELERDGTRRHGISMGDGPIDAAFLAIEKVIGTHYELDDFRISSVSRGQESMGEALVKLRFAGRVYSGTGASTDIIGASIRAYVAALNKIVFEER
jgi:2-isopropylmalate synthase